MLPVPTPLTYEADYEGVNYRRANNFLLQVQVGGVNFLGSFGKYFTLINKKIILERLTVKKMPADLHRHLRNTTIVWLSIGVTYSKVCHSLPEG